MAAERGRPREFKEETQTISLTIAKPTLEAMDSYAKEAGISRARVINELLCMANVLKDIGFIAIDDEGTEFHQLPKKQTMVKSDGSVREWHGLQGGMSFYVKRDQLVEREED